MSVRSTLLFVGVAALAGCQHNAVLIPNSDSSLNKSATSFAQEAAKRFPYPAGLEKGGELRARAEIGYMWNKINLVNYSGQDWTDVELWVNRSYVIPLATIESGKVKEIAFKMIYNEQGQPFPDSNVRIDQLELKVGGRLFDVPKQIGG